MKKIMMMVALVLAVSTTFAYTGEEAINKKALNSFKTEFTGATDADWTVGNNYYKVAFTMSSQKMFAFYNTDGEFMAATRYISSFQLPLTLQSKLKKSYSDYWISDLFEMATSNETGYYVTLEDADTTITLKSIDGSDWSVYKKSKKA
jgi:hypothetical protein